MLKLDLKGETFSPASSLSFCLKMIENDNAICWKLECPILCSNCVDVTFVMFLENCTSSPYKESWNTEAYFRGDRNVHMWNSNFVFYGLKFYFGFFQDSSANFKRYSHHAKRGRYPDPQKKHIIAEKRAPKFRLIIETPNFRNDYNLLFDLWTVSKNIIGNLYASFNCSSVHKVAQWVTFSS